MAEKDQWEKKLIDYADVFADILNVMAFGGKRVIDPQHLTDALPRSLYKADGKTHEQERDCAKYWDRRQIHIALLGLENQTGTDEDMILRTISYDGAAYRDQINRDRKGKNRRRYPVITFVLYFGYEKPWTSARTLKERFHIPEQLKPYFNDYRLNVLEVAYLSDEQVSLFQSDFRYVADYFTQMRKNQEYIPPDGIISHVREFFEHCRWQRLLMTINGRRCIIHT